MSNSKTPAPGMLEILAAQMRRAKRRDQLQAYAENAFTAAVMATLIILTVLMISALAYQRSTAQRLASLCQRGGEVVLYVGDTTTIAGRFVECGGDFLVLDGLEAPSTRRQRFIVPFSAVKLVREVPDVLE